MAKEGWAFILTAFCLTGFGAVMARSFGVMVMGYGLSAVSLACGLFCAYFFRDPDRPLPSDKGRIYSPGDGTVLTVAKEGGEDGETIRIFLSIFDVHVQRFPCWGTVKDVRREEGGFVAAMKPEADKNARNIVRIAPEGRPGEVAVEQITGLIARRIRCWTGAGEPARAGTRYGLIMFGSQVAVHVPAGAEPVVKPGDKVVGGITPIAAWTKQN